MPKELIRPCFSEIIIAHTKGDEYHDNWYDAIDMNNAEIRKYFFTTPRKDGDLYVSVETYPNEIIPGYCTSGRDPEGLYEGGVEAPILTMTLSREVDEALYMYDEVYHMDEYNTPVLIKEMDYEAR